MKRPPSPPPIRTHEVVIALVLAAILWLLCALLVVWIDRITETTDDTPLEEEEFLSEFRVEEREETPEALDEDEKSSADSPTSDPTQDTASVDDAQSDEKTPEQPPEETPPDEPETVVVIPEDDAKRQSVDQPTTNEETPDTDDYYLAEVDNRAEEETTAEDASTEYEADTPVDANPQESDSTEEAAVPDPTRDEDTAQAESPNEQEDSDFDDAHDQDAEGVDDAPNEEQKESEAGPEQERDQIAQEQGDRIEESTTSPLEEADEGAVQQEDSSSAEAFGKASGLGSKMQEAAKRAEDDGAGDASVTRKGAEYAKENFDEVLGERTAEYQRRVEQTRKEESLLGDHEGDWQRTRQAMENYDIAVTAGSETHLNTRRDDHAPFINAYHAKIHDEWWKVVSLTDRKRGDREERITDAMATTLEIRVLSDGTVDNVAVIRTSGDTFMDAEAIRVNYDVKKASPPSSKILCDDNSVYLHWQFSRGPARCSTQGASLHCPKGD